MLVFPNKEFGREVTGIRVDGGSSKEHSEWGIPVTAASCSVTLETGLGQRQEGWGSNV